MVPTYLHSKNEKAFEFNSGSNIYFTSDTHFNHAKIIEFCNRPFKNDIEMNEQLIANWNKTVGEDDIIFILGDFSYGGTVAWTNILDRLNGKKYLILGNHDEKNIRPAVSDKFEFIGYEMHITIEGRSIYLHHYPFLAYGGVYRKGDKQVWQLFGHVHSGPKCEGTDYDRLKYLFPTQYDVGVDNNNYTPVSYYQVRDIIEKQVSEYEKEQKKQRKALLNVCRLFNWKNNH